MSKLSYISSIKAVHIVRGDHSIFVSSDGANYTWRDNKGAKGSGEGYLGLHKLCDAIGDLSVEEYNYIVSHKV